MIPPQAGTSRCCLDFLFPLRCGRRAYLLLLPSLYPSLPLPGQQVGRVLFCLHSSGAFRRWFFFWSQYTKSSIDFNATFVKNSELNLSTFYPPATLAGMTVMSFCTSSFEGHLRISSSPDEKRSYLVLPDQFSCGKGCSQFHQLGLVVQTAFVNYLSAKNLFKLQPEHWKQQMSLVTPTHHVRLLRATGSQLLNVERLMSSETCGFVSSGPLTTFSCSASKKSVHSHFFKKKQF